MVSRLKPFASICLNLNRETQLPNADDIGHKRTFTGRRLTTIDSASTQLWDSELHAPFIKDTPGKLLMICKERGVQDRFIDVNAYDKAGDYWRVRRWEDEH